VVTSHPFFVYIAANRARTLYTGVTHDLERRMYEHQRRVRSGFTSRYRIDRLVYYEFSEDVLVAITREKQIKGWKRCRKIALIEAVNPEWLDLSREHPLPANLLPP
jgi:putative endonuclease